MADFKKIELPEINIDSLNDKLNHLLATRVGGPYSEDVQAGERQWLSSYWEAKNSSDAEFTKNVFEKMILEWEHHKPEVIAIILEDVITNGNGKTEFLLRMRDEKLRSSFKDSPEGTIFYAKTNYFSKYYKAKKEGVESGKISPRSLPNSAGHLFTKVDLNTIKGYLFERTFLDFGFSKEDIEKIDDKIQKIKSGINMPQILQYIYTAQNMKACEWLAKESETILFNEESLRKNIEDSLDNYGKFIIGQDAKVTLAKANFISFASKQPEDFSEKNFSFPTERMYFNTLMLPERKFYFEDLGGYAPEIEKAEKMFYYSSDKAPAYEKLPFFMIQEFAINECSSVEEMDFVRRDYTKLFMNYAFGELSEDDKKRLEADYFRAFNYYKDLEMDITDPSNYRLIEADLQTKRQTIIRKRSIPTGEKRHWNEKTPFSISTEQQEYIDKVVNKNLAWTGKVLESSKGTPVADKNSVFYFVFKTNGFYILEPLDQPNNSTIIINADKDIDEFASQLRNDEIDFDEMARNNEVIRKWHDTGISSLNTNRLRIMAEVISRTMGDIEEARKEALKEAVEDKNSLSQATKEVTKRMPVSKVSNATKFIKSVRELTEEAGISVKSLNSLKEKIVINQGKGKSPITMKKIDEHNEGEKIDRQ